MCISPLLCKHPAPNHFISQPLQPYKDHMGQNHQDWKSSRIICYKHQYDCDAVEEAWLWGLSTVPRTRQFGVSLQQGCGISVAANLVAREGKVPTLQPSPFLPQISQLAQNHLRFDTFTGVNLFCTFLLGADLHAHHAVIFSDVLDWTSYLENVDWNPRLKKHGNASTLCIYFIFCEVNCILGIGAFHESKGLQLISCSALKRSWSHPGAYWTEGAGVISQKFRTGNDDGNRMKK